jgi:hypothetical protein
LRIGFLGVQQRAAGSGDSELAVLGARCRDHPFDHRIVFEGDTPGTYVQFVDNVLVSRADGTQISIDPAPKLISVPTARSPIGRDRAVTVDVIADPQVPFRAGLRKSAEPRKANTNLMIAYAKAMTPEEIMAWMESLAKRQGADSSGFTTAADVEIAAFLAVLATRGEQAAERCGSETISIRQDFQQHDQD